MIHITAMKHLLSGLVLAAISAAGIAHAAQPGEPFVIERPNITVAPPLDKDDMARLAAGKAPALFARMTQPTKDGFVTFRCWDCGTYRASTPALVFHFTRHVAFNAAAVLTMGVTEGMRVLRGPDGAILQAATKTDCSFVSTRDKRIVIERYRNLDCQVAADGTMEILKGAQANRRTEAQELPAGDKANTRCFEVKTFHPDRGPEFTDISVVEMQETAGRVQNLLLTYIGDQASPATLVTQNLLQRVITKGKPGYRQIIKIEKRNKEGTMELDSHVIETWQVEKNGTRRMVGRQELKKPAEQPNPEQMH